MYFKSLTRYVDSKFDDPHRKCIFLLTSKRFQMIHNWATVATVLMREFDRGGGAQIPARVNMLKLNRFFSCPVFVLTNHLPIIPVIPVSVSSAKATDFLLSREGGFDIVGMQVLHAVQVGKSYETATWNGLTYSLTTGRKVSTSFRIIGPTDPPKSVRSRAIRDASYNLLSTATSQVSGFGVQKILFPGFRAGLVVSQFDCRAASHVLTVIYIQHKVSEKKSKRVPGAKTNTCNSYWTNTNTTKSRSRKLKRKRPNSYSPAITGLKTTAEASKLRVVNRNIMLAKTLLGWCVIIVCCPLSFALVFAARSSQPIVVVVVAGRQGRYARTVG